MKDDPTNETPNVTATPEPTELELWDRQAVLEYFGGNKPLHPSTLYRGMAARIYPRPINVSVNVVRWVADECRAATQRMLAARDEPKPPSHRRGRKPSNRVLASQQGRSKSAVRKKPDEAARETASAAAKAKTATEIETTE